jgi:septal ring factor EnvC (AmiA/AmiB activator)
MVEVTQELMYEVLKQIQSDMAGLKDGQREHTAALNALRTHMVALQQNVSNIYAVLVRHENRLDRIERRLNIAEVSP